MFDALFQKSCSPVKNATKLIAGMTALNATESWSAASLHSSSALTAATVEGRRFT